MLVRSILLLTVVLVGSAACSSGSGDGTGIATEAGTPETGAPAVDGGGGAATLNGCTTFVDESAPTAAHKIVWDLSVASSPTRCMTIRKGQTIAFEGNFTAHPLGASGGDTPTPFSSVAATGKVTFTAAGIFGFVCGNHPTMTGAIKVID